MITETGLKMLRLRLKMIAYQQEGMKMEIALAIKHNESDSLERKELLLKEYELEYETLENMILIFSCAFEKDIILDAEMKL